MALLSSSKLLLQTLVVLSLFLILVHSQDTTSFRFDDFDPKPNDAIYQGDVAPYLGLLSLNRDARQTSVGRVLYSNPVRFWDSQRQATFNTTITFYINQVDDIDPAEGIAFFIAPVNTTIPPDSAHGNLGIYNTSGLAAVEFDSSAQPWAADPDYRHIGINVNTRKSLAVTRVDDFFDQKVTATISYRNRVISVVADVGGSRTYGLNLKLDLKTVVPQMVRVGISGATGSRVEYNYIRSWSFSSALVRDNSAVMNRISQALSYV